MGEDLSGVRLCECGRKGEGVCVCVCVQESGCVVAWERGRVEESEGNGGEGGAMASTSNTEKRGRSTEENIARGVQSGNTSGGGTRSEKKSLVEYTKTIVRLLRSRSERSQMASDEDRVFEVSELIHEAAGHPDLGTVDADDRKKLYRRFYDVIKVLAACRIIFFPGVDNVSRATKFTIAGAHIQNRRAQGKGEGERGERESSASFLRSSDFTYARHRRIDLQYKYRRVCIFLWSLPSDV